MVATILSLIFVSGFYPVAYAVRSNRRTTLLHAIVWALISWFFWSTANVLTAFQREPESSLVSLLALALSGCASVAVLGARRPGARSEFGRVWLDFRRHYGLVWAQRLREQFNASATHADWPVVLRWTGLRFIPGTRPPDQQDQEAMLDNLRALMKRFQT